MNKLPAPRLDTPPASSTERLYTFRTTHHNVQQIINGHRWEYISCGAGSRALLVLPGGLAVSETAFQYILHFESCYRVIAPTYPATIMTMSQLVTGLASLLSTLQLEQVYVIGGSYSGLVAQCLVRHAPASVAALALSDTGVPRPRRGLYLSLALSLLHVLPIALVRPLLRLGLEPFIRSMTHDRLFWRRYFSQLIATLSKQTCVSHLRVWIDFDRRYHFTPGDLSSWTGASLIMMAKHDSLFRPAEQQHLQQLYPTAQLHTFAQSSHSASLARTEEYITVIERFFAKDEYA